MKNRHLHSAILRVASLLAPADQRAQWIEEWRSELWYVPPAEATRFCMGAFRDAFWLRRNMPSSIKRTQPFIDSPFRCLALLGPLAAVSIIIAARLARMLPFPEAHGTAGMDSFAGVLMIHALLGAAAFAVGDSGPYGRAIRGTPRGWLFLALKIVLLLPILQCGFLAIIVADLRFLPAPFFAVSILAFRWVFTDQRRRCPVCLRLLSTPVRIGTSSNTFLEWYGAESVCSRGHGLLHVPEVSARYCQEQRWLALDSSWQQLFSEATGIRH